MKTHLKLAAIALLSAGACCARAGIIEDLLALPRTVLATPASAVSIGELCLAVQSGPAQNSYLCAELAKADIGFKALMDQRRQTTLPGAAPQPETGHG